jgi:hypothetical protein
MIETRLKAENASAAQDLRLSEKKIIKVSRSMCKYEALFIHKHVILRWIKRDGVKTNFLLFVLTAHSQQPPLRCIRFVSYLNLRSHLLFSFLFFAEVN